MATAAAANENDLSVKAEGWWDRLDARCERLGDSLNPILVKETRQALKSRQFVTTFSMLLFAALSWTVAGSLWQMPQIYTSPSAPQLLIGYYVVLAIPMLIVVPLAAYRSLEGEIDDGTLELLSITALSPWHIVLGKLASAMLQMVLYYVALFPCVAYAYTLRGVDLPTTLLMMSLLLVAAIVLTVAALFFAPLARSRSGRIVTLLVVMLILLAAEWAIGSLVVSMIIYGNPLSTEWILFFIVATVLIATALGHLLLTATAAQLTPECENRSTKIRLSLMALTTVMVGLAGFAIETLGPRAEQVLLSFSLVLTVLWTAAGAMMAAESTVMTPRIRRELPSSFLARATLTWLTPGPLTGLIFASANIVVLASMVVFAVERFYSQPGVFGGNVAIPVLTALTTVYSAYLIGMLIAVRLVMSVIRINNNPRVEVGLAALIVVAVLAALVPYSVLLHLNDYRSYDYSFWQLTNWVWTIGIVADGGNMTGYIMVIVSIVTVAFFATLLWSPKIVFPRRIATPKRVKRELEKLRSV